jgi:hypothetical protein
MRTVLLVLCASLGVACGGEDDLGAATEAYCHQGCNYYYPDVNDCIAITAAQQRCTNCPEAHADRLRCITQFDCQPGPDDCELPSGCRYFPYTNGQCGPDTASR